MQLKLQLKTIRVKMPVKTLKSFLNEDIAKETLERTELLVDSLYSVYIDEFDKNSEKCVGWLDGEENSQLRPVSYTHLTLPTTPYV